MSDTYVETESTEPDATTQKEQTLRDIHAEAMEEFEAIYSAQSPVRQMCLKQRRFCFVPGAQYDDRLRLQFQNKPMMEMNKTHLHVSKIINDLKNNEVTVNYKSKDGSEDDITADALDGLYRADEQASNAEEAYDNATEEAVSGGLGAYRFTTEYADPEDPDSDHQVIRIKPIFDADTSVYFDLGAKRVDKADAKRCFVLASKTVDEFEDTDWPTAGYTSATSFPHDTPLSFEWFGEDVVYIAEYFRVEMKTEVMHYFTGPAGVVEKYWTSELKDDPEFLPKLLARSFKETRTKRIQHRQIHKYILSGNEVLEDCGIIAGKEIPIVIQPGERRYIDNVEWFAGATLYLMDPQVSINVQASKLVELAALSSRPIPIFSPAQIVGHETAWANQNIETPAFLQLNQTFDAAGNALPIAPQGYTQPAVVPAPLTELINFSNQMMAEIGGDNGPQQLPTDISGVALDNLYARIDAGSYAFLNSKANARKRGGVIYLSIAKDIYTDKGRKMKTVSVQGQTGTVELMQPNANAPGGMANDFTKADFDVVTDVGPSSSTKKDATVRQLSHIMLGVDDPAMKKMIQSIMFMNMDGPGLKDAQDAIRREMVQAGYVKPTEEEKKAMDEAAKNQQPSSADQANQALAMKLEADAHLSQAKITEVLEGNRKTQAETEKTHAQTLQILEAVRLDFQQSRAEVQALLEAFKQVQPPQPAAQPEPVPGQGVATGGTAGGGQIPGTTAQ